LRVLYRASASYDEAKKKSLADEEEATGVVVGDSRISTINEWCSWRLNNSLLEALSSHAPIAAHLVCATL
jgi:hypothetical protein